MKNILPWLYVLIGIIGYGVSNASMDNRFTHKYNPIIDRAVALYCGIMWPVFIPLTGYIDYHNGDRMFVHGWKL